MGFSIGMVAIVRFEELYINQWIEYHSRFGFSHFYIYDNACGSEKRIDQVLTEENAKKTTVVPAYDKSAFQKTAYELAYNQFGGNHDFLAFMDIDEYFTLLKHESMQDYFSFIDQKCPGVQDIRVNWEVYDDNNAVERDMSIPIVDFFTQLSTKQLGIRHGFSSKCIVRTGIKGVYFPSVHYPEVRDGTKLITSDSSGNAISPKNQFLEKRMIDVAKIRHYPTKTISEYMNQKLFHPDGDGYVKFSTIDNRFFTYCHKTRAKVRYYLNNVWRFCPKQTKPINFWFG